MTNKSEVGKQFNGKQIF